MTKFFFLFLFGHGCFLWGPQRLDSPLDSRSKGILGKTGQALKLGQFGFGCTVYYVRPCHFSLCSVLISAGIVLTGQHGFPAVALIRVNPLGLCCLFRLGLRILVADNNMKKYIFLKNETAFTNKLYPWQTVYLGLNLLLECLKHTFDLSN